MRNTNAKSKSLLLAAMVVGLVTMSSLSAGAKSWKDETVLISPQGDQTFVRPLEGDKTLFKNSDPQLAVEWALANARTAVVLAGKYVVSDSIDVPRDNVTLIIDQGAEISLNPQTEHKTDIGFRPAGSWHMVPLIYNHGHDNVRVIHLGTLVHSVWPFGRGGKQTFPIVFDGRNDKRTCGIEGGLVLMTGSAGQSCLLLDARGVQVPLLTQDSGIDAVLVLEGCDNCKLGMIANLAPKPGGKTGEVVDLNGRNKGITIDLAIGERLYEVIDNNSSYATVGEVVSIGKTEKLLKFHGPNDGARWTSRPHPGATALNVKKKTILTDAVGATLRMDVPKLPDALPRFTVKSTVEVTLKDGSKRVYTKEVEIDVRSAE